MRRVAAFLFAVFVVLIATIVLPASARPVGPTTLDTRLITRSAPGRPVWHFAASAINAGARPRIIYQVPNLLGTDIVYLDQFRNRRWVHVSRLYPRNGSGNWVGPREPLGEYPMRVVARRSTRLAISSSRTLYVYGPVSLAVIAAAGTHTTLVGGATFAYVLDVAGWNRKGVLTVVRTTCRSIALKARYLAQQAVPNTATIATIGVITRTSSRSQNVPSGATETLASPITGPTFQIVAENIPGTLFVNGTASCATANGRS